MVSCVRPFFYCHVADTVKKVTLTEQLLFLSFFVSSSDFQLSPLCSGTRTVTMLRCPAATRSRSANMESITKMNAYKI